jgi:hypothetical protein
MSTVVKQWKALLSSPGEFQLEEEEAEAAVLQH